jgi:hypothetical protein
MSRAMENSRINSTLNNNKGRTIDEYVEITHNIAIGAKRRWIQWIETIQ